MTNRCTGQTSSLQRRSLQRGSLPSTAVCHPAIFFIPVAVESLVGRRSSFYYRDWQKNDFQHRGSARNGVPVPAHLSDDPKWRFNTHFYTTPCVLQTLSFPIRRSHSGHYHLYRHHRRRHNNNNNNNNNKFKT